MMQRMNGEMRALGAFDYKLTPDLPSIDQLMSPEPDRVETMAKI